MLYRSGLYNLQTRKNWKVTKNWNWHFLQSQYWKRPISTLAINLWWSQIRGITEQNWTIYRPEKNLNRYNSNTKRSQIWIKLNQRLNSYNLLINKLERWNWTFHMTLLKALKYTPCLSFWACHKAILEFTESTHIIYWPAIIA